MTTPTITFHIDIEQAHASFAAVQRAMEQFGKALSRMLRRYRVDVCDLHVAESERWIAEAHRHLSWHALAMAGRHAFLAEWHRALGTTTLGRRIGTTEWVGGLPFPPSGRIRFALPTKERPHGARHTHVRA